MENLYFEQEMRELLGEEYQAFEKSQNDPMYKAIRLHSAKTTIEELKDEGIEIGELTPFDRYTYYLDEESRLGNHPFHNAGLYYLQEPSATMVVNVADIQKGDWVLDLCAAPGGKSTQILNRLEGTGFLVSNELSGSRAQKLLSNIERWSYGNYMITNMDGESLCDRMNGLFDKIIVDAPCSGASMFKKYPETIHDYTEGNVRTCCLRQQAILNKAYDALKQEGILVYSTCTYNKHEDEEMVQQFLDSHPDCQLVDSGVTGGRIGLDGYSRRVFPMDRGEGHFMAKIVKHGNANVTKLVYLPCSHNKIVDDFLNQNCTSKMDYTIVKDNVYVGKLLDFKGKVVRQSILMGTIVKNRLEPHHHFFTSQHCFKNVLDVDYQQAVQFMKGLTIPSSMRGYVQITYKNHPIGFGKGDGNQIKNHYPKGLRIN